VDNPAVVENPATRESEPGWTAGYEQRKARSEQSPNSAPYGSAIPGS